ncbi:MAG: hypothetical protein RJB45_186 [Pseudomonadota bacterium]|jgi:hypothetical protein
MMAKSLRMRAATNDRQVFDVDLTPKVFILPGMKTFSFLGVSVYAGVYGAESRLN